MTIRQVYILGFVFATKGIAARVQFSLRRVGKQVIWEQSKRLLQGSLIALTPANDMFKTICKVGIVAARPLSAVQQEPPEVDIFFARSEDLEIDPHREWVMVESRIGYFESARWTLQALQKIHHEKFPLVEHLVNVRNDVQPPDYILSSPKKDISNVFDSTNQTQDTNHFSNIDILNKWPSHARSSLDTSQLSALHRILSKRIAIIQGPPGTGKTHVSVTALKTLQANMKSTEPPIIVSAHTNHALDQILRHIAVFEPDFIRLGGMTLDEVIVKPRTLFEVRKATRLEGFRPPIGLQKAKTLTKRMCDLLKPLTDDEEPLPGALFAGFDIITATQNQSITKGAEQWHCLSDANFPSGDMATWLSPKNIEPAKRTFKPVDFGIQIEEADLDLEEVREIEAEQRASADDEIEALKGPRITFKEPWTGRVVKSLNTARINEYLKEEDLWNIPDIYRGTIYKHLRDEYIQKVTTKFRSLAIQYDEAVRDVKIGRWQTDARYLSQARIIGCTTTGLSKYRALLHGLKPKIVLIEEAAETLEAYVIAACFDSLEHLILVGDHQQLRPSCSVKDLEGHPFNFAVSMFERLVCNHVEFSQLHKQRRMLPEMRQALAPIYGNLTDHPCVLDREPIPGMGGVNSFFFSHMWHEDVDDHQSKVNIEEAKMIVAFFNYLVDNGTKIKNITILTFYNGQRKFIVNLLQKHRNLQGEIFNVRTVDSYQGEENEVVILSLVRSNRSRNSGFLSIVNRVCVAMSRAQRGLYIFGNAKMLSHACKIWWQIVQIMAVEPRRVGFHLPLTCQNHGKKTYVACHEDIDNLNGGCSSRCSDALPCGHACELSCHPVSHDLVNCHARCNTPLDCGHVCREYCYMPCHCTCQSRNRSTLAPGPSARPQRPQLFTGNVGESVGAYRDYATGGHFESDARLVGLVDSEQDLQRSRLREAKDLAAEDDNPVPSPQSEKLSQIDGPDGLFTSKMLTSDGRTRWRHEGLLTTEVVNSRKAEDGPSRKKTNDPSCQAFSLNPRVAPFEPKIMDPLKPMSRRLSTIDDVREFDSKRRTEPDLKPAYVGSEYSSLGKMGESPIGIEALNTRSVLPDAFSSIQEFVNNGPRKSPVQNWLEQHGNDLSQNLYSNELSQPANSRTSTPNEGATTPTVMEALKPIRQPCLPSDEPRWSTVKENMKLSSTFPKATPKPLFSDSAFQSLQAAMIKPETKAEPLTMQPVAEFLALIDDQNLREVADGDEVKENDKRIASDGEEEFIYRFGHDLLPSVTGNKGKADTRKTIRTEGDAEVGGEGEVESEADLWDAIEGIESAKQTAETETETETAEKEEMGKRNAEVVWNEGEGDLLGML